MTLISPELNRKLGNTNFETKKEVYAKDCLEITTRILEEEKVDRQRYQQTAKLACW